jgi:hypothetical protein
MIATVAKVLMTNMSRLYPGIASASFLLPPPPPPPPEGVLGTSKHKYPDAHLVKSIFPAVSLSQIYIV